MTEKAKNSLTIRDCESNIQSLILQIIKKKNCSVTYSTLERLTVLFRLGLHPEGDPACDVQLAAADERHGEVFQSV